ncbi:Protein kinase-like domain protein [Colletotrichum tabaci]|uniref:Protein kinase-like domain protein n=1 Tax=Colletotrichum tabaci TaxID=1209068 RepID=A0AAV9TLB4_9PEZI
MPPNISALSQYQIRRFFQENDSVTQQQCNAEAQRITGQSVTATACQGGTSYTVEGGEVVVQFRVPSSTLDMDLLRSIEQAYRGFAPRHEFFASAYHNTPIEMIRPDPTQLFDRYLSQLQQLRKGLPKRFHSTLDEIIPQLPDRFTEGWPLVPNHTDLFENNIHVNKTTGRIVGICDWRGAEVGPFGSSLGGLETMLGTLTTTGDFWRYHPNHQELRDQFWNRFHYYLGGVSDEQKRRIEAARLIGLFLANGFQQGRPATEESEDLRFLGAVILKS